MPDVKFIAAHAMLERAKWRQVSWRKETQGRLTAPQGPCTCRVSRSASTTHLASSTLHQCPPFTARALPLLRMQPDQTPQQTSAKVVLVVSEPNEYANPNKSHQLPSRQER